MINEKEFIRGELFPNICDMRVGTEVHLDYDEQLSVPQKQHVSIYSKSEYLCSVFNIISNNPDKQFTYVSHNSDMIINTCNIPSNLYRWFAQNRATYQKRIYSIPIGLENAHWFPYKRDVMLQEYDVNQERSIKAFAQFSSKTHPERKIALNAIDKETCDIYFGLNGQRDNHLLFCQNLNKYAFCLCPRGNGIDTHRIWEAIYMGCIPICKSYPAHEFSDKLPILFVEKWSDVTERLLTDTYQSFDQCLFNSDILKISYWRNKINNIIR
jgi:hypothetical protein